MRLQITVLLGFYSSQILKIFTIVAKEALALLALVVDKGSHYKVNHGYHQQYQQHKLGLRGAAIKKK